MTSSMKSILPLPAALICVLTTVMTPASAADIQTETIEYRDGDQTLVGYLAYDADLATSSNPRPGVLVVHQWMGQTDYEQRRCRELAQLGYVAFALDIYGKGVRPADTSEAAQLSGKFKKDRQLYRRRLNLGLDQLRGVSVCDADQLAAIGYCFGGTGVIELARSGADIDGVVSFHGGLDSPRPEDGKNIRCKILACHGEDDPYVPPADVQAFQSELNNADVDWQMIIYSDTVHSFTQPMAGDDPSEGAAYNAQSDKRSFAAMQSFFEELFPQ